MTQVLNHCEVVFDEERHTYTLNGKPLMGITGILHKYIFPDKYANIPQAILDRAAERGHEIHRQVQMWIEGFPFTDPAPEVAAFMEAGISFVESEYLVSDLEHFASSIDIVDADDNLYDIKTTYSLDTDYLSWQLSIYAYLFELQNKRPAGNLFGVWLRNGECKIIEVKRIEAAIIKALLNAAAKDEPFENPLATKEDTTDLAVMASQKEKLAMLAALEQGIAEMETRRKEMEADSATLKESLLEVMEKNGIKSFETDKIKLTVKAASERKTFDTTRFKADSPEVYEKYLKTSSVKSSLTIKLK